MRSMLVAVVMAGLGCGPAGGGGSYPASELRVLSAGGGRVTATPAGHTTAIDCGGQCWASFAPGTQVILEAEPEGGQTFHGWSGACEGAGPCVVEIWDVVVVGAAFTPPTVTWGVPLDSTRRGSAAAGAGMQGIGTVVAGNAVETSARILFVALVDGDGTETWRVTASDGAPASPRAAAVNGTYVAVVGDFVGELELEGHAISGPPDGAAFVAELDATGAVLGLEVMDGPGPDRAVAVAAIPDDTLAVVGTFAGEIAVGDASLTGSAESQDVFVAIRDSSGWSLTGLGGTGEDEALAIARTADGRLWVLVAYGAAGLVGDFEVGPGLVLVAYEDSTPVQAVTFGGAPVAAPAVASGALAELGDGEVLVAATFAGSIQLGEEVATSHGGADWMLARMRTDGSVAWWRTGGGADDDRVYSVAVSDARVYIGGAFDGTAGFSDALTLEAYDEGPDGFVAAYDVGDGEAVWARRFGGFSTDSVRSVARVDGALCVVGTSGDGLTGLGGEPVYVSIQAPFVVRIDD